jgi:hypothetical protein
MEPGSKPAQPGRGREGFWPAGAITLAPAVIPILNQCKTAAGENPRRPSNWQLILQRL